MPRALSGSVVASSGPPGSGPPRRSLRALPRLLPSRGTNAIRHRSDRIAALARQPGWTLATRRAVLAAQSGRLALSVHRASSSCVLALSGGGVPAPAHPSLGRALARLALAGFAGRFYQELSGGEQQRAQLARVLCPVGSRWARPARPWLVFSRRAGLDLALGHQLAVLALYARLCPWGWGVVPVLPALHSARPVC